MNIKQQVRSRKKGQAVSVFSSILGAAALGVGVVATGISVYYYVGQIVQHASDAATATVANDAFSAITVPLSIQTGNLAQKKFTAQFLQDNFGDIVKKRNGNVGIQELNQIIWRCTVAGLNATASGSPQEVARAITLSQVADELGGALHTAFVSAQQDTVNKLFKSIADLNLPLSNVNVQDSGPVTVAFADDNGLSDIVIARDSGNNPIWPVDKNGNQVKLADDCLAFSNPCDPNDKNIHVRGYNPLHSRGSATLVTTLSVIPDQPGEQTHGLSLIELGKSLNNNPNSFAAPQGVHPAVPNAFVGSASILMPNATPVTGNSAYEFGSQNSPPAYFPKGYIKIVNGDPTVDPVNFSGPVLGGPDLLDTILAVGAIYVGTPNLTNASPGDPTYGAVPYSRSQFLYSQWQTYAQLHPDGSGTQPPLSDNTDSMHFVGGVPGNYSLITPATPITAASTVDSGTSFIVARMWNEWTGVYLATTPPAPPVNVNEQGLDEVELFKADLMKVRYTTPNYLANNPFFNFNNGGFNYTDLVYAPAPVTTGLKLWNHLGPNTSNPTAGQTIAFGKIGTPYDLVLQCDDERSEPLPGGANAISHQGSAQAVFKAILPQAQQINPSVTLQSLMETMGEAPVIAGGTDPTKLCPPGTTLYLYNDDNGNFIMSPQPPALSTAALQQQAYGITTTASTTVSVAFSSIDARDCGLNNFLFATPPDDGAFIEDIASVTTSCGANQLLAIVKLSQKGINGGYFARPN
jgi:hypothetical protein